MFGIVGGNVSGFSSDGLMTVNASVGTLLSGGRFGIEASLLCPIAALLSFILLNTLARHWLVHARGASVATSRHPSAPMS